MKFAKMTSTVLASAAVLMMAAPSAIFAATLNGGVDDNDGTALPQNDRTKMGISFGDNSHNANTGYLRLQMVPHVLDFGNHNLLDTAYPVFSANGQNDGKADNNRQASYADQSGATNLTATLNTKDSELAAVKGTAWATVVDKQVARTNADANNTAASGKWTLSVKADNGLAAVSTDGNRSTTDTIDDAHLSFNHTAYAQTADIFGLTGEGQDADWATSNKGTETATKIGQGAIAGSFKDNVGLTLNNQNKDVNIVTAEDGEGQGANVFGWTPSNIKLTMPTGAAVSNATYQANLTWTLASTAV